MVLDAATRRNLELTETLRSGQEKGSLLGVLDHTVTPMGARLLRQWVTQPLLDCRQPSRRGWTAWRPFMRDGLLRAEVARGAAAAGRPGAHHQPRRRAALLSRAIWSPCAPPCGAAGAAFAAGWQRAAGGPLAGAGGPTGPVRRDA